ncbi:MAG TPA: efflux RND transporter periplasmic adaptor subunit, partial [Anaerolineae bacterium]|nr:efflux RND transporter periplasmic adaptor subunit [Anaerolineae bacterium]
SVARQGNIVISATAAGTIVPATDVVLGFPTNGTLAELLVGVGDDVAAGDVLARLDDADAQQALANAQIQLNQAAMKTDASTTQTGISFDEISIEQARINLEQAQKALDDLLDWEPDENDIAIAEANLEAAEAGYNAAVGQEASGYYGIQVSQINLEQAQADLVTAQENYEAAWSEGRDWETQYNVPICDPGEREPCTGQTWAERIERDRESASSALSRAQDNLALAEIDYNRSVSNSSSSSSANAQTSVLNAQITLDAAMSGPTEDEIEAAEIAIRQAELNLKQALLNQESNTLSLAQSQLNLEAAQTALDETALLAPMAGTIMAVNASVGESVGAGLITLADLEQPILEVFLDETDMNMVGLGYDVEVIFDALPDDLFEGRIIQIDPQLTNQSGVTAVRALVQLDTDSFTKPQTLPVGMNATVEVIGGRAENAVLVPVEALRELSAGQFAVFVMEDGEPVLRMVEVGLMDFSFAEILSGLEAGQTVTTGIVQTQ